MALVRAIYHDGKFEPLDQIDLEDGQEVQLQIVKPPVSLKDIIGDMLTHFEPVDDVNLDEERIMQDLDQALAGKRPLSEIIIEERREGR